MRFFADNKPHESPGNRMGSRQKKRRFGRVVMTALLIAGGVTGGIWINNKFDEKEVVQTTRTYLTEYQIEKQRAKEVQAKYDRLKAEKDSIKDEHKRLKGEYTLLRKKEEKQNTVPMQTTKKPSPKEIAPAIPINTARKEHLYVVQPDEYLVMIAKKISGDGSLWKRIYDHNKLKSNVIEKAQILRIPSDIVKNKSEVVQYSFTSGEKKSLEDYIPREYYEATGKESLRAIAKKVAGDEEYYDDIFEFNSKFNKVYKKRRTKSGDPSNFTPYKKERIRMPPELIEHKQYLQVNTL